MLLQELESDAGLSRGSQACDLHQGICSQRLTFNSKGHNQRVFRIPERQFCGDLCQQFIAEIGRGKTVGQLESGQRVLLRQDLSDSQHCGLFHERGRDFLGLLQGFLRRLQCQYFRDLRQRQVPKSFVLDLSDHLTSHGDRVQGR